MSRVSELLREFGQTLQPMKTANKDGRTVLAYSDHFGMVPVRWFDTGLPKWVESSGETGFLDRAFIGWYDPSKFRPIGEEQLTRLIIAYIDDMRAADRLDVLKLLDSPASQMVSNDNPAKENER